MSIIYGHNVSVYQIFYKIAKIFLISDASCMCHRKNIYPAFPGHFFKKYWLKTTHQNMDKLVPSTFMNVFLLNISIAESTFLQLTVMFLFLLMIISPWRNTNFPVCSLLPQIQHKRAPADNRNYMHISEDKKGPSTKIKSPVFNFSEH